MLALFAGSPSMVAAPAAHAAEQARTFIGRAVGDVLDELRAQGLTFIYNTRIVPADLRVEREPHASSGLALATEILAAHGLRALQAAPGVYAVVAASADAPAPKVEAPAAPSDESKLEEIVVHASRYTLTTDLVGSEAVLTQADIQNMPRFADETLRAVQRLPGFSTNGFSSLGAVRGGEPNETAIVLDGLRLYEPFHLKNFLTPVSLLDSRVIGSMEVYSGGFAVTHGERMSAIIEASSVEPAPAPLLRSRTERVSCGPARSLAVRRRSWPRTHFRGGVAMSAIWRTTARRNSASRSISTCSASWTTASSDATRASFNALASSDRITAIKDSGRQRANAEYRNVYAWGTLEHDWSQAASTRAILSYTDVNNERLGQVDDPGRRSGQVRDIRNFHVIGLRADHRFDLFGFDQRLGLEVRRLWGHYDYASNVRFESGFPVPGLAWLAAAAHGCTEARRIRVCGLVGHSAGAGQTLDAACRAALRHADLRWLGRRGAGRSPVQSAVRPERDDAPARELGQILPGAGDQ